MKNLIKLLFLVVVTSCSSTIDPEDIDPTLEVNPETLEKIKEVQDANVELEAIDGELDSLIIKIK